MNIERKPMKTVQRENQEYGQQQADTLREMAMYAECEEAGKLYEALAAIRGRDGVALTQHHDNTGKFVDEFIDDLIAYHIVEPHERP